MVEKLMKEEILKIVKRIKKKYQAERIILFGSQAYGKPHENSDKEKLESSSLGKMVGAILCLVKELVIKRK